MRDSGRVILGAALFPCRSSSWARSRHARATAKAGSADQSPGRVVGPLAALAHATHVRPEPEPAKDPDDRQVLIRYPESLFIRPHEDIRANSLGHLAPHNVESARKAGGDGDGARHAPFDFGCREAVLPECCCGRRSALYGSSTFPIFAGTHPRTI